MEGSSYKGVVTVLGKEYRVRTSASQEEVLEAAALVEDRVRAAGRGGGLPRDAIVLAALTLAGELLDVVRQREQLADRVDQLLGRVNEVLGQVEGQQKP